MKDSVGDISWPALLIAVVVLGYGLWVVLGDADRERNCAAGGGTWIVSTIKYDEGNDGRCLYP